MQTYKFDCNGNNAPAYGCSLPGDNSGEYYRVSAVAPLVRLLERTLSAHEQSCVDWDAMRGIKKFLAAHNQAVESDGAKPCASKDFCEDYKIAGPEMCAGCSSPRSSL